MFGLANEEAVQRKFDAANHAMTEMEADLLKRMEALTDAQAQRIDALSDVVENLRDEKANLEARVDELEKSYASGSIQREQNEEPAVQVAPGFERFSSRKRRFEREHAADGMTPTGRQIAANMKAAEKPKPKAKEKR